MTQQQLEAHLWGAANILRGRTAGQDYKTYILSLMFFKRLSDQWDYEADEKIRQLEQERGRPFAEEERVALRASGNIHRFKIPDGCHWSDVLAVSENIGEALTRAMRDIAAANPELTGVLTVDWNQPAPAEATSRSTGGWSWPRRRCWTTSWFTSSRTWQSTTIRPGSGSSCGHIVRSMSGIGSG